jgi:hypothetical protein
LIYGIGTGTGLSLNYEYGFLIAGLLIIIVQQDRPLLVFSRWHSRLLYRISWCGHLQSEIRRAGHYNNTCQEILDPW